MKVHVDTTHHIYYTSSVHSFDLTCKAPDVLYEEVIEVDERVMLAEFFDENRSDEEIELLEQKPQSTHRVESIGPYSSNYPEAGVGERIKGITGEKVGLVVNAIAIYRS